MSDVINLRLARKARKRAEEERRAAENRAKHGRTKAERQLTDRARDKHDAVVEGAFRNRTED